MHSWETFTRDDVCPTNPKFGERSHESVSCSDHSPLDHSLLPSSRLTTATGGRCLKTSVRGFRLRSAPRTPATPSEGASRTMRSHSQRCWSSAQSSIRRWYWFAKARIRPVLKLTGRTHDDAEIRSGSLELFRPRRARRPRWGGQQLGLPSTRLKFQNQQKDDRFKTFDERHVWGARHIEGRVPAQRPVGCLNAWRTREASSLANASVTGACPMIRRKYSGPVNASMSRSASVSGGSSPAAMA